MRNFLNFRKLKLWLLIVSEIIKRNRKWVLLVSMVLLLVSFAQFKFRIFNQNSISLGFIGTYQEHDLPLAVTRLLSQGLVKADGYGRFAGSLVSGWETNNDATVFKFKLKDQIFWADNTPINSTDLEFAVPNLEVTYPDEKHLQFNLKESYSPLPSLLNKPLFKKGMGTGPYKIAKIEKSRIFITKLVLKSDDSRLPIINVRFYPSEDVAIDGFHLGEVQALFGISDFEDFSGNGRVSVKQSTDYSKIVSVLFQTTDPLFSNRSLRQALSYITPQIEGEDVANNPYPPNFWAYDKNAKKYLSNPEEAKSALERAKTNTPEEKLSEDLILTASPTLEEVGERIAKAWQELGLNVKLRVESGIPQNFQALLITQSIPEDPDQYFLWHSTQTKTNLTKYDSKRADKDLEDGRKEIIEEERKNLYFDFQRTLLEDAPAVFLYFPKYNIVHLKKVESHLNQILSLTSW